MLRSYGGMTLPRDMRKAVSLEMQAQALLRQLAISPTNPPGAKFLGSRSSGSRTHNQSKASDRLGAPPLVLPTAATAAAASCWPNPSSTSSSVSAAVLSAEAPAGASKLDHPSPPPLLVPSGARLPLPLAPASACSSEMMPSTSLRAQGEKSFHQSLHVQITGTSTSA